MRRYIVEVDITEHRTYEVDAYDIPSALQEIYDGQGVRVDAGESEDEPIITSIILQRE